MLIPILAVISSFPLFLLGRDSNWVRNLPLFIWILLQQEYQTHFHRQPHSLAVAFEGPFEGENEFGTAVLRSLHTLIYLYICTFPVIKVELYFCFPTLSLSPFQIYDICFVSFYSLKDGGNCAGHSLNLVFLKFFFIPFPKTFPGKSVSVYDLNLDLCICFLLVSLFL